MTRVLMSPEKPDGFKLEELLPLLIEDMQDKVQRLEGKKNATAEFVRQQNRAIISCFMTALQRQNEVIVELAKLGADQGPTGTPRI